MLSTIARLGIALAIAFAILGFAVPNAQAQADLLVSARFGNNVLRYSGSSGAAQGQFNTGPTLSNPAGLALDSSGDVFVANFNTSQVLAYSSAGAYMGVFASNSGAAGFGSPLALRFGPDHNLYVTSNVTPGVYEFSGTTGAFIRIFASGGGLNGATGLAFMPGGDLLVSSALTNPILRYNGTTGAFIGPFGTGATLNNPTDLQIGPDGDLYAASTLSNQILRYNLTTGAGGVFTSTGLSRPIGLAFDAAGNLYAANQGANNVLRFAHDGTALGPFVPAASGGLNGPDYLAFTAVPEPAAMSLLGAALLGRLLVCAARSRRPHA